MAEEVRQRRQHQQQAGAVEAAGEHEIDAATVAAWVDRDVMRFKPQFENWN